LFHSECYTFLQDWYLPNLVGNLHAKQEWELFGAAHLGERVRSRAFVAERYRKRTRDYVVCETLLFDATGAVLLRGRTHQSFLTGEPEGLVVDREREKSAGRRFEVAVVRAARSRPSPAASPSRCAGRSPARPRIITPTARWRGR
jgi:hypothetical protein